MGVILKPPKLLYQPLICQRTVLNPVKAVRRVRPQRLFQGRQNISTLKSPTAWAVT